MFSFLIFNVIQAQESKSYQAFPVKSAPVIDGILSEKIWDNLVPATNFSLMWPETRHGNKIPMEYETIAYLGFDQYAIYVGVILKHPNPDMMPKEFSQRDEIWNVNAETFFVTLNTYNDDLNFFGFQITSAGTVGDVYSSGSIESDDFLYDTVFDAKAHISSDGWSVEMAIPYSAIRFPEKEEQLWGLNFGRKIQSLDETFVWNPVNINEFEYHESNGTLTGINNISPPVRLFFYPMFSRQLIFKKGQDQEHLIQRVWT